VRLLSRSTDVKEKFVAKKKAEDAYVAAFQKAAIQSKEHVYLTDAALSGLTTNQKSNFLESKSSYYFMGRKAGSYPSYKVQISAPTLDQIIPYAQNPDIRKDLLTKYHNQFKDIDELALKVIKERYHFAQSLGYQNFAEYQCSELAVRNVESARKFLKQVWTTTEPYVKKFRQRMQELAKKHHGTRPMEHGCEMFYRTYLIKEQDAYKLGHYLRTDDTIPRILEKVAEAHQVKFKKIEIDNFHFGFKKDHQILEVYDASNGAENEEHIGYIYLKNYRDKGLLIAKEAAFPNAGFVAPGHVHVAINSEPASTGLIKMMDVSEIVALAHELGHAIHFLLYPGDVYGVTDLPLDIIEFPSTLTENWIRQMKILSTLAYHDDAHAPDQLLKCTQRDLWYYAERVQKSNLYLRLHDFDPTNMTKEQLRRRMVDAWNEYNPNTIPLDYSFNPLAHVDVGLAFGQGIPTIAYLLCEINTAEILQQSKEKNLLKARQSLLQREFNVDKRENMTTHPFKMPQSFQGILTRSIKFV